MNGYTKLFGSILASTIWGESKETKVLWITMLAMADQYGEVQSSVPGLATLARLTLEETEEALETLSAPDPYSRTKDFDGRRIQEIDGGWLLLNHGKYREKMDAEDVRIKNRERQRLWRERNRLSQTVTESNANNDTRSRPEAEAEANTSTSTSTRTIPDLEAETGTGAGTGVLKSGAGKNWGKSVFKNLTSEDLSVAEVLDDWLLFATDSKRAESPILIGEGGWNERTRLLVHSAAERAIDVGRPPLKLFKFIVGHGRWNLITQAQEERGLARLRKLKLTTSFIAAAR